MYHKIEQFKDVLWGRGYQLKEVAASGAVFKKILQLRKQIYKVIAPLHAFVSVTKEPVPFEERKKLTYKRISNNSKWGGFFDCAWFNFKGIVPDEYKDEIICLFIDLGASEGCVFDSDGSPDKGLCRSLSFSDVMSSVNGKKIYDLTEYKKELDIWVDAANNGWQGRDIGKFKFKKAEVVVRNQKIFDFYFDFLTIYILMLSQPKDSELKTILSNDLKKVAACLNSFEDVEIDSAKVILQPHLAAKSDDEFTMYAAGHAHLDLAWLWPIRETVRKAERTFSNQLYLTDRHPDYVFGASQPQQFEWMKNLHPKLYSRIKDAVAKGSFEAQGGMWVEADTNVTGAESLVRQVLYGKRFFRDEFQKDMKILWLPDVFGFSGALPQIIKKTGMEYFLTIKLTWNNHNKFPYQSFLWKGIDGSEILVHMPPDGNYNSEGSAYTVNEAYSNYKEKNLTDCAYIAYGVGDGGGGPAEGHYEVISREGDLKGMKKVKLAPALDFFNRLNKFRTKLPAVSGEIYLEKHQGTLTTQANNKKLNRKIELALRNTEFIASAAYLKGIDYPKAELDEIWKEVLLYQFHDILPGSSIQRVYTESVARYNQMIEKLNNIANGLAKRISDGKNIKNFVNTLSFDRTEFVKKEDKWYLAKAAPFASATLTEQKDFGSLNAGADFIENEFIKITFDSDGIIKSYFNKAANKEYAGSYLNRLSVYKDKKLHYNAWDIDIGYTKQTAKKFEIVSFENILDGAQVIRRTNYKYNKSTLSQDVILTSESKTAIFKTDVDWHETHKMLRADFYPSVYSEKAVCNIQWGNIERSTKTDNKIDWAQFEVAAHKFVYVKEDADAFAVMNDCKYGYRAKDGIISLNLLRSPVWPDKDADRGKHSFTYAVFADNCENYDVEVIKNSYRLNQPLIEFENDLNLKSMFNVNQDNIIIETVKKAEDRNALILRAYEAAGKKVSASLKINFDFKNAFVCDMMEENLKEANLDKLNFTPFEIKTVLFEL